MLRVLQSLIYRSYLAATVARLSCLNNNTYLYSAYTTKTSLVNRPMALPLAVWKRLVSDSENFISEYGYWHTTRRCLLIRWYIVRIYWFINIWLYDTDCQHILLIYQHIVRLFMLIFQHIIPVPQPRRPTTVPANSWSDQLCPNSKLTS